MLLPRRSARARRRWQLAALGLVGLTLAGSLGACSGDSDIVACPRAAIMPDLQAILRYKPGPGRADSDLAYGTRLNAVTVNCSGKTDKKTKATELDVTTKLGITARRTNPSIKGGQVAYFVAVVNRNNAILAKREFVVAVKFEGSRQQVEITDELSLVVPLAPGTSGSDYAILCGFQLSPDELQFNRAHLTLPGSVPPPAPAGVGSPAQPGAAPAAPPGAATPAPAPAAPGGTAPPPPHL